MTDRQHHRAGSGLPETTDRRGERGSALILAIFLIVILTFLGFGLLTRSIMVTRIAGSERWSTKAFYAADAGLDVARARLRVNRTEAFTFNLQDLRGASGTQDFGNIQVAVDNMQQVGPPRLALGSQTGGGQGSESEPLYMFFYRTQSTSQQQLTGTERVVTSVFNIGPMPQPAANPANP